MGMVGPLKKTFSLLIPYLLIMQYLLEAKKKCPSDPLVYNELGVVAYHMKE